MALKQSNTRNAHYYNDATRLFLVFTIVVAVVVVWTSSTVEARLSSSSSLSGDVVSIAFDANVTDPVSVFFQGEAGYYCIKIPDLLTTMKGTLIAFGEARKVSCADHTWIDLVYKRSEDGGLTWSPLEVLYSNSSDNYYVTIGNAAPVQGISR